MKRKLSLVYPLVVWHPLPNPYYYSYPNTYINCDGCKLHNALKGHGWCDELVTLGYSPSLPTPTPVVQTTLCVIDLPNLHKFIQ